MLRAFILLVATIILFGSAASNAQTLKIKAELLVSGDVEVKDGDTIAINKVLVRLSGIDAPEGRQQCAKKGGGTWDCAGEATKKLRRLIEEGRGDLRCEQVDTDTKHNRPVARCWVGTIDIQRELVKASLAWAYRRREPTQHASRSQRDGRTRVGAVITKSSRSIS